MRWWRLALLVVAGALAAAAGTVLAVVVNVATGGTARWFPAAGQHPLWWTAGATASVAGASLLVWGTQRWYERGLAVLVPAVQRPEPWVVDRPGEVAQIVAALRRRGGMVGITTAVHGAGGFGKTTVAKLVRADRRVLRRFGRRVYWVTLGRDVGKQALTGLVNGLIAQLEPGRAVTFTDARQAGEHVAAMLAAGPRRLLVLDDVWTDEQLAAFPVGGRCVRLVTTRIPSLTVGATVPVKVDQMSGPQARALLGAGLPSLAPAVAMALVEETGRWPLLLRLVNKILTDQARLQPDITAAAEDLLARLRADGALQVDQLTGAAARELDVSNPDERNKAVRATIQASASLLTPAEYDRFAELAVFAEDETFPVALITALWRATGRLDEMNAGALCARLADLALVTLTPSRDGGVITMHDVIRDLLHEQLGGARLAQLHGVLLDAVAAGLPRAAAAAPGVGQVTAWWELPQTARYLQEHLIEHLLAAGLTDEAEELAGDLRWAGLRLQQSGPAGPYTDLALVATPRADRLRRVLGQAAHLLAPADPPHSLIDILYSRVSHDPDWAAQVQIVTADRKRPALINRWPLPDLPGPALRRTLLGHIGEVEAVAIAPDGSWLASGGGDGSVRIWDAATGRQRAILTGHTSAVTSVAIAPDGTWLATAGRDDSVRIWDAATGRQRAILTGHTDWVKAVAIAPDGSWLASAGDDGSVRIWDAVMGRQRAILTGHTSAVTSVAIAPDGTWLASAGRDDSVRIWDAATGRQRPILTGRTVWVTSVAIAPDGSWLASAGIDGSVRIWDAATGRQLGTLAGHTDWKGAVAIAPDGTWLAIPGRDGSMRIWDAATGRQRAILTGHTRPASAVAIAPDGTWLASASTDGSVRISDPTTSQPVTKAAAQVRDILAVVFAPDGSWLATSGRDGSVRIWDAATAQQRRILTGHTSAVTSVAIAPDGSWLATASQDDSVRIWDAATGQQRAILTGHTRLARAVAIAPDGSWLASAGDDRSVRIWDPATGRQRAILTGHPRPATSVTIAPDGTWLASASRDGSVRIWDAASWQQRAILTGHTGPVWELAIAPDGRWLASAGDDGSVRIRDAATGQQQRAIITGRVAKAVAIAPDGTWLASVGDDRSVRIWDAATGAISAVMRVDRPLETCAWSPSGKSLAAAGDIGLYHFTFKP